MALTAIMLAAKGDHRDRVGPELAQDPGRERQQGHEGQVDDGQAEEAAVDRGQPGDEAVVGHPVGADHEAADEERHHQGHLVLEEVEQGAGVVGGVPGRLGHADLHHEQGHGDREHRVGEEDDPAEVEVLALAGIAGRRRHRRLLRSLGAAGIVDRQGE
jgi:hypothetical protein